MQDESMEYLKRSLDRLLLYNRIHELTKSSIPLNFRDGSLLHRLVAAIIRLQYGRKSSSRPENGRIRRLLVDSLWGIILRLLMKPTSILKDLSKSVKAAYEKLQLYEIWTPEVTGYVTCTDKEEPLIRVCMLLRLMKRYGSCIEFLIRRFNSGLPAINTRQWLSFFLREIGDIKAANMLSVDALQEPIVPILRKKLLAKSSAVDAKLARLKYALIITALSDSDVFRRSLSSLLSSDFQGEIIVVEEGAQPERLCESFCTDCSVKYVKSSRWDGPTANINLGIEQLEPETDIVIYAHNDLLWPRKWFFHLNEAWERVYSLDKVGVINLGYMEFFGLNDPVLYEMFIQGRYDDLLWILKSMKNIKPLTNYVNDVQNQDLGRFFGLGRDPWNDKIALLRIMTGRNSVVTSFPVQLWRELGGFDPISSLGADLELQFHCLQNRKWNLWISNTPPIHMRSYDVHVLLPRLDPTRLAKMEQVTYEAFFKKYGWEVEHFVSTFFAETCVINFDQIIEAVNNMRFTDIDFVFDDFFERLKEKKLASCEIVWCKSRSTCLYR